MLRRSFSRNSFLLYILLSTPSIIIQIWFERIARPSYVGGDSTADLRRSGEDLEAKGLTEWMWDVLYWTWGCLVGVALLGDRVWWAYSAVPLYSIWLAWSTFRSVRQGFAGGLNGNNDTDGKSGIGSKRQQKLEKRSGPKMQHR